MTVKHVVVGVLALTILVMYAPAARDATQTSVWGYDRAFRWLRDQRGPDDVVLTVNMPACVFVLGHCDYVAVEKGYEGYATQDEQGRWVGGWDFIPLLTSPAQLDAVLDEASTAWFVVDSRRLYEKYTLAFVNRVWQRMDLAHEDRGALVFRSWPAVALAMESNSNQPAEWSVPLRLASHAVGGVSGGSEGGEQSGMVSAQAGQQLPIVLWWEPQARQSANYAIALKLIAPGGRLAARQDEPPIHGRYPSRLWRVGEILVDRHTFDLPLDMPAGRYRLELELLDVRTNAVIPLASGSQALLLVEVNVSAPDPA